MLGIIVKAMTIDVADSKRDDSFNLIEPVEGSMHHVWHEARNEHRRAGRAVDPSTSPFELPSG